jgi:hypothetical protein
LVEDLIKEFLRIFTGILYGEGKFKPAFSDLVLCRDNKSFSDGIGIIEYEGFIAVHRPGFVSCRIDVPVNNRGKIADDKLFRNGFNGSRGIAATQQEKGSYPGNDQQDQLPWDCRKFHFTE